MTDIVIPKRVLYLFHLRRLTSSEVLLYGVLKSLGDSKVKNEYLADVFHCHTLTITRMLNKLIRAGLLERSGLGCIREIRVLE